MVEAKRKERIKELETLVAMLGDSIHLEKFRQKATEEMELLKKKGVDKRPLAQQVASMNIWIERESKRINLNQEELDRAMQTWGRQIAHFNEEKDRLEKLKAELAAAPIATPLDPEKGKEDDEMMMDVTEEGLRKMKDEELELRRMVAAKAGSNGEKLSVKRVQEISKQAEDEISASLGKRQCKKDTRLVSWNVAGVAIDELDLFFAETSALLDWDILMLQEASVKTEGIPSDSKHVTYTPDRTVTGLRTPAIVVNEKSHGKSRLLNSGIRWVAVELSVQHITTIFVSVHLPHARAKTAADFQDTLQQISSFLRSLPAKARLCLGIDANTRMIGYSDGCTVGDAVPDDPDEDSERPQHLYEFLQMHRLWLPNTWLPEGDPQLWKTRFPWDNIRELRFDGGGKQIDFIALSLFQSVDDVKIERDLMFSSDHLPLTVALSNQNRRSQAIQTPTTQTNRL